MGEFHKAEYAWMIPTLNGVIMRDNPLEPGTRPIYKIKAGEVEKFQNKFSRFGIDFMPLYSGVIPWEDINA